MSTYQEVEAELLAKWPETRLEPSTDRIVALCDLLGDPQRAYPVIHITGTNGKTSTARMIEALLRSLNLRTGRFTSPHLERMTERIVIDGEPVSEERFTELYDDLKPYAAIVDEQQPHPLSYFELMVAMGYAAFADAPVDVAVVEVGLGGTWDATNVMDAVVAVVTPVAIDHARLLGDTVAQIASEKAGIIKKGSLGILAQQPVEAAEVLLRRSVEVGATIAREGMEFGVLERQIAVGGQMLTLRGLAGEYDEIFLPLHGEHQAHNAVCALAAVEAFLGTGSGGAALDVSLVREAFGAVQSPGRLEVVRRSPTVLIDAAHNPAGARATAAALSEEFDFTRLVGVFGAMRDKDVRGVLEAFEPVLSEIVITRNASYRASDPDELAAIAVEVFGDDRVTVTPRLDDAIDDAVRLAEEDGLGGAVVVTGSVVTAGEARTLLSRR